MIKCLWVDTETTGLDPHKHEIVQLAGIIEAPGVLATEFNYKVAPLDFESISDEAMKVHGMSIEEVKKHASPKDVHMEFKKLLYGYVSPYDPMDKLILCGQNVQFDSNMLRSFFAKQGDKYWDSLVTSGHFDLRFLSAALEVYCDKKIFKKYNLSAICDIMNVSLSQAHDAMHDIKATRECCLKIWNIIQGG